MTQHEKREYLKESVASYAAVTRLGDALAMKLVGNEVQRRIAEVVPDKPTLAGVEATRLES